MCSPPLSDVFATTVRCVCHHYPMCLPPLSDVFGNSLRCVCHHCQMCLQTLLDVFVSSVTYVCHQYQMCKKHCVIVTVTCYVPVLSKNLAHLPDKAQVGNSNWVFTNSPMCMSPQNYVFVISLIFCYPRLVSCFFSPLLNEGSNLLINAILWK